jgi:putative membrane protein
MMTIAAGAIELSLVCARRRIHYHAADVNLGATRSGHMIGFLLRAAIAALGLWLAAEWLPGLSFDSTQKLVIAALLLGIVNAIVRPIAFVLTLPITVLTLGLFLLVLNAGMIALVAWLTPGFRIDGFWTAFLAALIVGVVSWVGSSVIGSTGKIEIFKARRG